MDSQEIPKTYLLLQNLGSGLTSSVKLALDGAGKHVVVKQYKDKLYLDLMLNQAQVLLSLNHPNIVQVIDFKEQAEIKHTNGEIQNCSALILQYFKGGQLYDLLSFHKGGFSQKVARTYFIQMISALNHIHQEGYAHRDIKHRNILFSDSFQMKIVDFGFSCQTYQNNGILTEQLGSNGFMAPQIYYRKYQGTKVDIFAAGVTLFWMFARLPPFNNSKKNDPHYRMIMDKRYDCYWRNINRNNLVKFSSEFKDLFVKMVHFDPNQRITIPEILNHPWTNGQICSPEQLYKQLSQRKKIADRNKQEFKQTQGKKKKQHMDATNNVEQFSTMRGSGQLSNLLLSLINQEMNKKRELVKIQRKSKSDIVLNQVDSVYPVARIKQLFKNLQIDLSIGSFQPIDYNQAQRDALVRLQKIQDNNENEIQAEFKYSIEIEDQDLEQNVKLIVIIGKDEEEKIVFRLIRKDGDEYAFMRILNEVKKTFAYAVNQF